MASDTSSTDTAHAHGARRLVRRAVRRHWRALGAGGIGAVMVTLADLAAPFPLAWVIDEVLDNRVGPFDLSSQDIRLLAILVQAVVVIAIVSAIGTYLADTSLQRAGEQITHDLRVQTYGHLQRLSLAFHDQRRKGDLITRLTGDVNAVGGLFSSVIGNMIQAALIFTGMLVVAVWLDPLLAVVLFAATPILAFVTSAFRRRIRAAARDQRRAEAEIASLAAESLSAMRVVKAFGTEEYEQERVVGHSDQRRRVGITAAILDARFAGIVDVLGAITMAVVLAVGVVRVSDGALTVGGLVIFLHYARRVYRPLRDIAKYSAAASRSMARAERIADLLAADQMLDEAPGAWTGPRAEGRLGLEGVSFGYDPERPVIRDVTLSVAPGETVAVVGPSGAGKSTLGALVARFYDPSDGRVTIDGHDARECSLAWLREQVGFLLQETVLFSGTIADNIAYGIDATREEVVAAARAADADEFIAALPEGYDTMLGPQGVGLSGGQRQRIGVARVLLRNPPILVLDEPTTGLDATSEAQLVEGLGGLMSGRSSLLITHSLALARRADRVVVISGGVIAQEGRPEDLLTTPGPFRQLASLQGLVGRRRAPVPAHDAALPTMRHLLDPDAVAQSLERMLPAGTHVEDLRIVEARYRPASRLAVHYRVDVGGESHDAVARITTGSSREAASDPAGLAAAAAVNGRSPATSPLGYDARLDALIQWLPLDVDIPASAVSPDDLVARLRAAGCAVAGHVGEPERTSYRPGRRLTLRFGSALATCWGRPGDAARAATALTFARRAGLIGEDEPVGHLADLQVTVAPAVAGVPVGDAMSAARDAGELLARVHALPAVGLEGVRPAHEVMAVNRIAAVVAAVAPDLRGRVDALVARLVEAGPRVGALDWATAQGSFRADRLVRVDGRLRLHTLDTMCSAPAAADLASYAAAVFDRPEDWPVAHDALTRLLAGYGRIPAGLDWYLAVALTQRVDRPFRRQEPDWPARMEGLLSLAESVIE